MAIKTPYMLDCAHISGHGRAPKYVNILLLPKISYIVSFVRSDVKMGYNVTDVTLLDM